MDYRDTSLEEYERITSCIECGRSDGREGYEQWLRTIITLLERIVAMNPEERAEYERQVQLQDALARPFSRALFAESRPPAFYRGAMDFKDATSAERGATQA